MDQELLELIYQELGCGESPTPAEEVLGHVDNKTSKKRVYKKGGRRATWACISCRSRKVRCNVVLTGPPCYNCTYDKICCEPPTKHRQRKARALLEKSLQNHVPRISPNEAVALQPPMAHNPFEGEFGFAGDLEMMFESELSTNLDCPCEQFGILACPFCDTEQLSKNEIKGSNRSHRNL